MHTDTHVYTHTHMCTQTHAWTHTHTHTHIHLHTHTHTRIHTHADTQTQTHTQTHTSRQHTHTRTHTRTHIHTHTHTHTPHLTLLTTNKHVMRNAVFIHMVTWHHTTSMCGPLNHSSLIWADKLWDNSDLMSHALNHLVIVQNSYTNRYNILRFSEELICVSTVSSGLKQISDPTCWSRN